MAQSPSWRSSSRNPFQKSRQNFPQYPSSPTVIMSVYIHLHPPHLNVSQSLGNGQILPPWLTQTRPPFKNIRGRHRTCWRTRGWWQKGRSLQGLPRSSLATPINLPQSSSWRTTTRVGNRNTQTPNWSRKDESGSPSLQVRLPGAWVGKIQGGGREMVDLVCECDFGGSDGGTSGFRDGQGRTNSTIPTEWWENVRYGAGYAFASMGKRSWYCCSFWDSWYFLFKAGEDIVSHPLPSLVDFFLFCWFCSV